MTVPEVFLSAHDGRVSMSCGGRSADIADHFIRIPAKWTASVFISGKGFVVDELNSQRKLYKWKLAGVTTNRSLVKTVAGYIHDDGRIGIYIQMDASCLDLLRVERDSGESIEVVFQSGDKIKEWTNWK